MENDHPLMSLNRRRVGHYQVRIEFKPLQSPQGWGHFLLYLENQRGKISSQEEPNGVWIPAPVLQGIHSRGGRGVTGWIEVGDYHPVIHFERLAAGLETLVLSELRLKSALSVLRDKLIAIYPHDLDTGAMEQASHHCCQLIHDDKAFQFEEIWIREELGRVSRECLEVSSMNRDDGLSRK